MVYCKNQIRQKTKCQRVLKIYWKYFYTMYYNNQTFLRESRTELISNLMCQFFSIWYFRFLFTICIQYTRLALSLINQVLFYTSSNSLSYAALNANADWVKCFESLIQQCNKGEMFHLDVSINDWPQQMTEEAHMWELLIF